MEEEFCIFCGNKMSQFPTGKFNGKTGEPEFIGQCMNLKCEFGCFCNGGHFQKLTILGRIKPCTRCGSERVLGVR